MAVVCLLFRQRCDGQECAGDCDGDGQLAVSELIQAVRIALGTEVSSACTAADVDGSGAVGIVDLLLAVSASLGTCSARLTASGLCMQPGATGLESCNEGMEVRVFRCDDPARCLTERNDPGVLTTLAFGAIGVGGNFSLSFPAAEAGSAPLVFEAQVDATTTYRVISFGRIAAGGGSGLDLGMLLLAPSSEAAVRLLAENGFENFSPDVVLDVIDAVALANADTSFAGLSPEAAAVLATNEARNDPAVIAAIEQGLRTPTPTATPTRTRTPTATRSPGGDGEPQRNGAEFIVNTYTLGGELDPRVASDGSGRFIVVWRAGEADSIFTDAVVGRVYDAGGNPLGADFRVDTFTLGQSDSPGVGMDAAGNFVVAWESDGLGYPGGVDGVVAQRFDSAGRRRGAEFQVASPVPGYPFNPSVGVDPSGSFVVVWVGGDGSVRGLFGQRFASAGDVAGTEFQVNSFTLGDQSAPAVVATGAGGFAVAWTSGSTFDATTQDGDECGVFAQRFDPAGNRVGAEFQVNSHTGGCQSEPALSALAGNLGFVVAWGSDSQDGYESGIFAQRFAADGARVGPELQVNTFTFGSQEDAAVTAYAGGGFVVVWESEQASGVPGQDGSGDAVFGQRFDGAGLRVGAEFQVNAFTIDDQDSAAAAGLTSDGFVVVWEGSAQDGAGYGIFGQRFRIGP